MDCSNPPPETTAEADLLSFASRAQALIAELLLLSGRVPPEFREPRFDPVLFDLRYFDSPNEFESRIEGNIELETLEDQLRESCSAFLNRFFLLINGAVVYHFDLVKYLNNLQEGLHACTLDIVLDNKLGQQLLLESMALFGCLLLLMMHHFGGLLQEKLLVAYVRHNRHFDSPHMEHICLLCRVHPCTAVPTHHAMPILKSAMIAVSKVEDLFSRFPLPKVVVDAVINRVRDEDFYNQACHYPDPQHRTVALSMQGGYLYVLLFYSPGFLHNGLYMRQIVDRFFKDCWVVPIFMYFVVDLFASWDAYKEAKASLLSCLSPLFIQDRSQLHCSKVKELLSDLSSILSKGVLTRDYVLENAQNLIALIRNCNISLRWLLLQRNSIDKKLKDIVTSAGVAHQVDEECLLLLFLKTSQLEFTVKQLYAELVEGREALWLEMKHRVFDCLKELSGQCSGSWASSYKIKNESLNNWLEKLLLEVDSLDCLRAGTSSRTIYHVASAFKDLEQIHQIEEIMQSKQWLSEAQKCLQNMVKVLNLDNDTVATFSVISDAVYAWGYTAKFSELLGMKVEQEPSIVLTMHTFFLKFQSFLNAPLLRIAQNQSPDLLCVSKFYSSEYVAQVFATLETLPVMLFRPFSEDEVQNGQPFNLLTRISRDDLHDFLQLDRQLRLARRANGISIFSQGISNMSKNLLGVVNLDMKEWLEGQIQKELLRRLENKLNLSFLSPNVGPEILEVHWKTLSGYILSQLHMMEAFQDLLHIRGNQIWEETFTEVLKRCARKVHAGFINRRQNFIIPSVQLNDLYKAGTFFGNLLNQILKLTAPSQSMFIEPMSGWFDAEGHELLGLHFFDTLHSCVGQVGLASLDSLLVALITQNLEHAARGLKILLDARCLEDLSNLDVSLGPAASLPLSGWSSYRQMVNNISASWEPWIVCMAFIGQLQLIRCLISSKLKSASKVKAGHISFAVEAMTTSIDAQKQKILECMGSRGEGDTNRKVFLQEVRKQQKLCGFFSSLQTVYISEDPPPFLGRCTCALTISQLSRYVLDTHLGTLTCRLKKSILDFCPLVIGLGTFLRQFHPCHMIQYVQYMGQYVRIMADTECAAQYEPQKGTVGARSEVLKSAFWVINFCKYMGISKDLADSCLPPSLLAILQA